MKSNDDNMRSSYKMSCDVLVVVLQAVLGELCRSFYGVTAVTAESYGCVWHLQQRYAGHATCWRCHWSEMEWTYGAITFLNGRYSKIGEHRTVSDAQ